MDNWTYDNPTKPGLYWRRFDYATEAQPKPELVEVVETPDGLKYRFVGKSSREDRDEFHLDYFGPKQWWGPISVAMPRDS